MYDPGLSTDGGGVYQEPREIETSGGEERGGEE